MISCSVEPWVQKVLLGVGASGPLIIVSIVFFILANRTQRREHYVPGAFLWGLWMNRVSVGAQACSMAGLGAAIYKTLM